MTGFNAIQFAPSTKKLSIHAATGAVLYEYDLSVTAVKLAIVRNTNGQLEVDIETGALNSFATNRMELKFKFSGQAHYTSMLFDKPAVDITIEMDGDDMPLSSKEEFAAGFVGSDDIRNNRVASTHMMMLEGEIASFEIDSVADMLIARYHDDITPNV